MRTLLFLVFLGVICTTWAQICPRCIPYCQNGDGSPKLCGSDGCGGSCGECAAGQSCCSGTCACVPSCAGRSCGSDGCGYNSCGRCASPQTCIDGQCVGTAIPDCAGRVCGSDGAGGLCGTCPLGQKCRNGQCQCYYDCQDRNCGNAVQAIGTSLSLCPFQSCGSCPSGFTCGSSGLCSAVQSCSVNFQISECSTNNVITGTCSASWAFGGVVGSHVTPPNPWTWQIPSGGYGTYSASISCNGYAPSTQTFTLTNTTTTVNLCVNRINIPISVIECGSNNARVVSTANVMISGITTTYSASLTVAPGSSTSWTIPAFGDFSFSTSASGYLSNTEIRSISASTNSVTLCLSTATVLVDVRDEETNVSITVGASVTYSGVSSGSFRWTGLYTWVSSGFGQYTFIATPDSTYNSGSTTISLTSSVTMIIIYVKKASFCGDGLCSSGETATFCQQDCIAIFLEFENADGSGPVNGPTVNYFLSNPRDQDQNTGPNRNSVTATTSRTTGTASNTVLEETYSYKNLVFMETVVSSFISFYWVANASNIDPALGTWRLRVHLSRTLGSNDFNYRFVNTWKPIDATPEPYGPTDLNLHLFHSAGALDINNPTLLSGGFSIGKSVADSKQSGGPATMDISPGSGVQVAVWNSKPPRSSVIAPSQNGRYLVDSGSYIVVYGKTTNAASGKQLGQVILDELFLTNPSLKSDHRSDLWYVARFTVSQPAQNQPSISSVGTLKSATITSSRDMVFDCEAYAYCAQFRVPYSDTGRKREEEEEKKVSHHHKKNHH